MSEIGAVSGLKVPLLRALTSYGAEVRIAPEDRRAPCSDGPRILQGHAARVDAVAVTPDGRRAVSASWDHTLKLWDIESGNEVRTLQGHDRPVDAVAVTPDGESAVSASWDYTLKVWA